MSVTLSYQPITEEKFIRGAMSSTVKALEKVFGSLPLILTEDNLPTLCAMAAASGAFESGFCPFDQILKAVHKHSTIQIVAN